MRNIKNNNKNLILASVISLVFLLGWQYFYEAPRQQQLLEQQSKDDKPKILENQEENYTNNQKQIDVPKKDVTTFVPVNLALKTENRVYFENSKVKGSINPVGLKIDNLSLKFYKTEGIETALLFPSETKEAYFVQFGFASENEIKIPNNKTIWSIENLGQNNFKAFWKNDQGFTFVVNFKLDENYMFDITSSVINNSNFDAEISPFVRILRTQPLKEEATMISHEGFVYNLGKVFSEIEYGKIKDKKRLNYKKEIELFWGGFTDKYWLTSFFYNNVICFKSGCKINSSDVSVNHFTEMGVDRYQIDFIANDVKLPQKQAFSMPFKFFAGAKELKLLDDYKKQGFTLEGKKYEFTNFDKTVDFGIFYFLTKPIFLLLTFLNSFLHNFGFAIILLTIIVKAILFPIATKSYISMGKMKALAPEIKEIRENSKDKLEQNRKIMELYKEKQVNPLSGCLPIMLQIPVFFALYKVLYISLEMRGAEFIWWINDLSAKDPTSIFNLFGLLPFGVPSFLQIGVLPILMGITTYLQQSLSPRSSDPTQDMIIKTMPFLLIFIFAGFPAGIVLYWVVNNILSMSQQLYIEKIVVPKKLGKKKALKA